MNVTRELILQHITEVTNLQDEQKVLENIETWVKAELINESSGHDWYHIKRVTNIVKIDSRV